MPEPVLAVFHPVYFVQSGCLASEGDWPFHSDDYSVQGSSIFGIWQRPWSDLFNEDERYGRYSDVLVLWPTHNCKTIGQRCFLSAAGMSIVA